MKEVIPDPRDAQIAALDRMARAMGVNTEDFDLFKTDRPAWEAKQREKRYPGHAAPPTRSGGPVGASSTDGPSPTGSRPVTLEAALDTDRMLRALGVSRQDLARYRVDKLQEAIEAYRRGEPLSAAQVALVAAAAATSEPAPARSPISAALTPSAPAGRVARMKLDTFGETR